MTHVKVLTATILFCLLMNQSCSQSASSSGISKNISFEATTPCNEEIREMLGIPGNAECGMMKWKLSLYRDDKNLPSVFDLTYTYGEPKQASRGFKEGAQTIGLKGNWTIKKNKIADRDRDVITLIPVNSPVRISFLQPDKDLLHLLNKDNAPMVGTAAWSFTLNNPNPVYVSTGNLVGKELASTGIISDTDTVGVFLGRTPCNESLRRLNNISAEGCQIIKCRLVLLQDVKTQTPAGFLIQTIYVGKGDNKYSVTGKWKVIQGTSPKEIIYRLLPDAQPGNELLLLKTGSNLLFFINKNSQLLVGNDYVSYTLNRTN